VQGQFYLGAISGTSVDGLDLALLSVSRTLTITAAATVPLPDALRATLLQLGRTGNDDLDLLGESDVALGMFIAESVLGFLADNGIAAKSVTAIGSHGQTVRHRPDGSHPFTLQIGDPNQIAERTGITTVADFRRRDMAAGGQGAPLVPPFHAAVFRSETENRAVLNLGGIGNFTFLPADPGGAITGFDTGPANALMDDWTRHARQQPYDHGGEWAASGRADDVLLERLLADPYLSAPPPKSTGREYFNLAWLNAQLAQLAADRAIADADVQATLCAFTAESIARALDTWGAATERLLVCGGGRHNRVLLAAIAERTRRPVETTDDHGVDGDSVEAAAFAWLAHQTLQGQAGNAPTVTGARGERILGAIYPS
jgi:anhydro-N-acetylmuramic acid kinase